MHVDKLFLSDTLFVGHPCRFSIPFSCFVFSSCFFLPVFFLYSLPVFCFFPSPFLYSSLLFFIFPPFSLLLLVSLTLFLVDLME
ncbi:predicted protein [Methanosarcina acetivorans C2A]|uniref:Uncharacterized protein n=1 Tax=Methanosarcina acetivorans (strain ATCC 35395 / DSM 2834 / JCM 12185 / C2A) TaxID=188937 RepID=Q8TL03_METAC|nr:predicted protein [Methanosarcina acetivorans C2A]